jgi:hypothetical protein
MHSHPSNTRATVNSTACNDREGAAVRCIGPSFSLGRSKDDGIEADESG